MLADLLQALGNGGEPAAGGRREDERERGREDEKKLRKTQEEEEERLQGVGSPVLQLVHAGIGRTADAGDLLPLLPLGQLLRDEIGDEALADVQ